MSLGFIANRNYPKYLQQDLQQYPQSSVALVIFAEEIVNGKLHFLGSVKKAIRRKI